MTSIENKQRGRPKKYLTEEERLQAYKDVHKTACKRYWKQTIEYAKQKRHEGDQQQSDVKIESQPILYLVSEKQIEEMVMSTLEKRMKNIFVA